MLSHGDVTAFFIYGSFFIMKVLNDSAGRLTVHMYSPSLTLIS